MAKKILVAYATHAGSTAEVARAVGEEIVKTGREAEVLPNDQVRAIPLFLRPVLNVLEPVGER